MRDRDHRPPPIEEPALRHRRKHGKKTLAIEACYTGKVYFGFQNNGWRVWARYETERDRANALDQLRKKITSWEFRIPDEPLG